MLGAQSPSCGVRVAVALVGIDGEVDGPSWTITDIHGRVGGAGVG
jgi:hypothetical protein